MTDDLPTPPLPDAIASTRVFESMNGFGRCCVAAALAVRRACEWPPPPWSVAAERGALLVGHDGEVDVDVAHVGERAHRVGDPLGDLGPQRAAGDGQRDRHADPIARHGDAPHHLEIDDRLVDLGVLDGPERVEHLGLGGHWAAPGNFHYLRR